ncbi:hypothetical protein ACKVWM_011494 [Pyricularia oryzae]
MLESKLSAALDANTQLRDSISTNEALKAALEFELKEMENENAAFNEWHCQEIQDKDVEIAMLEEELKVLREQDPVKAIIHQLKQVENVRSAFELGNGIIFENNPYAISDLAEEVVYRDTPSTPPATPNHRLDLNRLQPDQICVYRSDNAGSERRTMIYIS